MIRFITNDNAQAPEIERGSIELVKNWSIGRKSVGFDLETTGLHPMFHKPILLILGDKIDQFVIDLRSIDKVQVIELLDFIKDLRFIGHNTKFDYSFIAHHYSTEIRNLYCTMLAHQILTNGLDTESSLEYLVYKICGKSLKKQVRKSFINKPDSEPFTEEEILYAADDVQYLHDIAEHQMTEVRNRDQVKLVLLENAVTPVVANIELCGINLDIPKWQYLTRNNKSRADKVELLMDRELVRLSGIYKPLRNAIYLRKRAKEELEQLGLFGESKKVVNKNAGNINYSSNAQVLNIYKRCGVQLKGVGEDELAVFLKNNPRNELQKFTELLLYYKKIKKRISTYGDSFLDYINPVTGRIHTHFTQCFTATGRFSSGDSTDDKGRKLNWSVNFQNIPALTTYRSCFVPPNSNYKYITLDLSGAEIVIAASNSQDELVLKSQNEGLDLHSLLASKSYSVISRMTGRRYNTHIPTTANAQIIITKKDEALRTAHKPVLFSVIYKAGAKRVSELLDCPVDVAKVVLEEIYKSLPTMKAYIDKIAKQTLKRGYVVSDKIIKRRRYFEDEDILHKAYEVEKAAANFPIQSTNANMIKMALVAIDKYLRENDIDAWIVNTVHDKFCRV